MTCLTEAKGEPRKQLQIVAAANVLGFARLRAPVHGIDGADRLEALQGSGPDEVFIPITSLDEGIHRSRAGTVLIQELILNGWTDLVCAVVGPDVEVGPSPTLPPLDDVGVLVDLNVVRARQTIITHHPTCTEYPVADDFESLVWAATHPGGIDGAAIGAGDDTSMKHVRINVQIGVEARLVEVMVSLEEVAQVLAHTQHTHITHTQHTHT